MATKNTNHDTVMKTIIFTTVLILISFYIVYSPTVFTPYFILDDAFLYYEKHNLPLSQASIRGGRPLLAVALSVVSKFLHSAVNDDHFFITMRFMNMAFLALTCSMFAIWLARHLKESLWAPFISLLVFFLPGYQITIGQASPIVTVWSFPLVMGALWLMGLKQPLFQKPRDFYSKRKWGRAVLAVLFLVTALFTYQLHPLFFLNGAFAVLLFGKYSRSTHRVIAFSHLTVFIFALVLYFILFKLVLLPWMAFYDPEILNISGREDQFPLNSALILSNIKGMFSGLFIRRLGNLWIISMDFSFAKCLGLFMGAFFGFSLFQFGLRYWREKSHGFDPAFLYDIILFLGIFIGINILNIRLIPNYSFRSLAPSSAFLIILFLLQITLFVRSVLPRYQQVICLTILGTLTFVSAALAQYNTYQYYALQSNREILFFETQVEPFIQGEVDEIQLIRPKGNAFLPIGDEHSRLNSGEHLHPLIGMLKYTYKKNGKSVPFKRIYSIDYGQENYSLTDKTILIQEGRKTARIVRIHEGNPQAPIASDRTISVDMNYLLHKWGVLTPPNYSISSSRESGVNTVWFAFDGQNTHFSFWEVGPLPVSVEVSYEKNFRVTGYSIVNVDSNRMPVSWKIEGLSKENNWKILDEQNDVPPWEENEKRTYTIANSLPNQKYRLTFTKGMWVGGMRIYEILLF